MATSGAKNARNFNRQMHARSLKVRSVLRALAGSSYRSGSHEAHTDAIDRYRRVLQTATLSGPCISGARQIPLPGNMHMTVRTTGLLRAVEDGYGKLVMTIVVGAATAAAVRVIGLPPRPAVSLPLYARQTGQPCATCHTAFLELTPFGCRFKLGGYTLGGGDWAGPPFAVMLQPTFTHTEVGQEGGAAPHFGSNNNFAMQQASLFTGGRITDNLGAFIQGTYDGIARRFAWDNTDIRYADLANVAGHNLLWGVTANNNPTVQDVLEYDSRLALPFHQLDPGADADCRPVYR